MFYTINKNIEDKLFAKDFKNSIMTFPRDQLTFELASKIRVTSESPLYDKIILNFSDLMYRELYRKL